MVARETAYAIRCVIYLSGEQDHLTLVDEISKEMTIPKLANSLLRKVSEVK
jgi:DNA-binding IscR family transcriptional regulator